MTPALECHESSEAPETMGWSQWSYRFRIFEHHPEGCPGHIRAPSGPAECPRSTQPHPQPKSADSVTRIRIIEYQYRMGVSLQIQTDSPFNMVTDDTPEALTT